MNVIVQHTVTDYDAWKPAFDRHGDVRQKHHCLSHSVYRGLDDRNLVTTVLEFPDRAAAEGFASDPSLREAMTEGGVVGAPTILYVEHADHVDYSARKAA